MKCVRIKDGVIIPFSEFLTWQRINNYRLCAFLSLNDKYDCSDCAFRIKNTQNYCIYMYKNKIRFSLK